MAGLGRIQQRFNAAVVGVLAALVGFARGGSDRQATKRLLSQGHPVLRKFLRSQNRDRVTGRDLPGYSGYCAGAREQRRRFNQLNRGSFADILKDAA